MSRYGPEYWDKYGSYRTPLAFHLSILVLLRAYFIWVIAALSRRPELDLMSLFFRSKNDFFIAIAIGAVAIVPTILVAAALAIIAYLTGNINFSAYLHIPHLPLASELVVVCTAIVGAGLGFLWFNTYPAQVFMGDVGSLALGGALGIIAVLVRQELLLIIMGGVFVMEALSVILQVGSYKLRGQRIFRMAPIHHHYELKGWPEPRVIVRFWIISIVLVLAGLATLKIR